MSHKKISVVKASGKTVLFNKHKLESSLRRSGATTAVVEEILSEIDGMAS